MTQDNTITAPVYARQAGHKRSRALGLAILLAQVLKSRPARSYPIHALKKLHPDLAQLSDIYIQRLMCLIPAMNVPYTRYKGLYNVDPT